jgi:hypothetical protein
MKHNHSFKTFIISIILVAALGLFALPLTPAQAAAETENGGYPRLEELLRRENYALERQGERLAHTEQVIAKTQALIEKAQEKGLDTSDLEDALATYQERLPAVQAYHDQAASILANPAGFDTDGKVTDRQEAFKTLRSAGEALRRAHLKITEAGMDLRAAVRAFLQANKAAFAPDKL